MQHARAQDVMVGTPVALSCSLLMHEAATARDYRRLALRLLTHHRGMSRLMEVLADECQQRCETLQRHDALARLASFDPNPAARQGLEDTALAAYQSADVPRPSLRPEVEAHDASFSFPPPFPFPLSPLPLPFLPLPLPVALSGKVDMTHQFWLPPCWWGPV